jgi:hypothetical protein
MKCIPIRYTSVRCTPMICTPVKYRNTPMRYTPVRYTAMRYMPVRYTPMRYLPIRYTLVGYMPVRYVLIFENRFVVLEIFVLALASLLPTVREAGLADALRGPLCRNRIASSHWPMTSA